MYFMLFITSGLGRLLDELAPSYGNGLPGNYVPPRTRLVSRVSHEDENCYGG